jgi:hypothetical protein
MFLDNYYSFYNVVEGNAIKVYKCIAKWEYPNGTFLFEYKYVCSRNVEK